MITKTLIYFLTFILCSYGMLISGTRGALIAILVGFFVYFLMYSNKKQKERIQKILDKDEKAAKILEIRTVVAGLEEELAANVVDVKDKDFWNKLIVMAPGNSEFWNKIEIKAGNNIRKK